MTQTTHTLPRARSWLFAPGDSEKKMHKASDGAADIVILDLASTPAIAQRAGRASDIWEAVFPTIMMGDDRATKAVYVMGEPVKTATA